MSAFINWLKQHHLLFSVLLIGAAVRCYGIIDAGFHHDELSALLRTRFSDFSDLIRHGVMVDGHPAFTQVFLWFWTSLFGSSAALTKLPFVFAGCFSIYLLFLIAEELFSKPVAFLSATGLAVLQYAVIYSQWARPYAFGLLFTLWAMLSLLRYKHNKGGVWLIHFAIASALAAYTHYFALLEVMVIGVLFWLFMFNKIQRLYFTVAALVAMLLWLPHLSITLHHLSIGGLGDWLKPPSGDFAFVLLAFSANYSTLFWPLVIVALFGFFAKAPFKKTYVLNMALLLGAIIIPYVVGFAYSHLKSALLHEGNMLFAFPFLLLLFAGAWQNMHYGLTKLAGLIVLLIGTYTLFAERLHAQLNLTTEFNDPFNWHRELAADYSEQGLNLAAIFDLRVDAVKWLGDNHGYTLDEITLVEGLPSHAWQDHLNSLSADALLLVTTAASEPELLPYALHHYPHIEEVHHYRTASCYLLTRYTAQAFDVNVLAVEHADLSLKGNPYAGKMDFHSSNCLPKTIVAAKAQITGLVDENLKFVLEAGTGKHRFWRAVNVLDYQKADGYFEPVVAVDLRDIWEKENKGSLTTYLWNPAEAEGKLQTLSAVAIPSNPVLYGLFNPVNDKSLLKIEGRIIKSLLTLDNQNQ